MAENSLPKRIVRRSRETESWEKEFYVQGGGGSVDRLETRSPAHVAAPARRSRAERQRRRFADQLLPRPERATL